MSRAKGFLVTAYLIAALSILLFSNAAFAWTWDDEKKQQDELKYNPYEREWSYEEKNSELKHNPYERKWEYVEPGEELKYNPFERRWEYAK